MSKFLHLMIACLFCAGAARAALTTQRVANTSLALPAQLPSTAGYSYAFSNAFGSLTFSGPINLATAPGETNRIYVVERGGAIQVITNLLNPNKTLFMNIGSRVDTTWEGGLLGLAFHPQYVTNRHFYVYYTATGPGFSNRVSRFTRLAGNLNAADTNSEVVIFGQFDDTQNHNAGDLKFGPDGYLYVGMGDEGGSGDNYNNSQIIDKDLFAGMLRLDIDKRPGSLAPNPHPAFNGPITNFAIPPDNPLHGVTNFYGSNVVPSRVRTEFYAVGLRNPFRFCFDKINGQLLCGDVGQGAWEEVNLITNGGNYGWAFREGFVSGSKFSTNPASAFSPPLLAYAHGNATNRGDSITGGMVYYGSRFPELYGQYIFGDYVDGHVWAMSHNGVTNTSFKWLVEDNDLAAFGEDPNNGDILACDLVAGQVKRLLPAAVPTNALPTQLSAVGVFSNLPMLAVFPGILPYDINVPFWSDNALKRRWFSVPGTNLTLTFDPEAPWTAPTGTVWIKHFDLLLTSGVPNSARRLETRLLVKNNTGAGGYGITYRWGESTNDAALVPNEGLDEPLIIDDGGTIRTQVWRYPSRSECLACHRPSAGFALSFSAPQHNLARDFNGEVTNQIAVWDRMGYFSQPLPPLRSLRAMAHATNASASLEQRVRSYLQVNCSQCHAPGGPVPAGFDARLPTPLSQARIVNGTLASSMGNPSNRVVTPAQLALSMMHTRINVRGGSQMPPLGSNMVDTQNVALVSQWIGSLAGYQDFSAWQLAYFGSTNAPEAQPDADPDLDGAINKLEQLTGTHPTNGLEAWTCGLAADSGGASVSFERPANRGVKVQTTTNIVNGPWEFLDAAGNEPFFGAAPESVVVQDAETNLAERFYRVEVYEP